MRHERVSPRLLTRDRPHDLASSELAGDSGISREGEKPMLLRKAGLLTCAGIAVFCAAVLTGCGGNNSLGPGANTTSRVRVFNALENVPNNAAIDILTSNNSVA